MTRSDPVRVTVINDHPEFLELMQDLLQDASFPATLIAGDRPNVMELIEVSDPELLIIDLRLGTGELKGMELLRAVRAHQTLSEVPTIVCTGDHWALEEIGEELRATERVVLLSKPFTIAELHARIDEALGLT